MKICIKNGTLISMSNSREKIEKNIDILIEDNKIVKMERNINTDETMKVIDATNKVIMPGLINTHAHLPMSIFRETIDGYTLQDWLTKKIWPMEDKLTEEDIYYASYLSNIEMIKGGTTTINDMYFMTNSIIKAAIDSGVRIQTTRTLMGNADNKNDLDRLKELETIINQNKHDRITFNIGVHGLYTTYENYFDKCLQLADKYDLPIHMHFCENETEKKDITNMYNKKPISILKEKLNGKKAILAHCVKLSKEEIEELAKENISVSHCPVSNLKLGCGIADINEMYHNKINISLGTDGQGSGSNLDMFETMKYTALLQKGIKEDPTIMNAYDVMCMATINGAKALGLEDKIGSIDVNKLADIIIIDLEDIKLKPINNIFSEIVYNVKSNNVDTTIIDGKILMENHKLINDKENLIINKCEEIINRIVNN